MTPGGEQVAPQVRERARPGLHEAAWGGSRFLGEAGGFNLLTGARGAGGTRPPAFSQIPSGGEGQGLPTYLDGRISVSPGRQSQEGEWDQSGNNPVQCISLSRSYWRRGSGGPGTWGALVKVITR